MKRIHHFLPALLLMSISFVACDQREFEMPPLYKPVYSDTATMTIAEFKTKFAATTAAEITDTITISGVVVANDNSGNMYKEMTIMDSTGGLKIAINQGDLYTEFRLGQRVFIECKGLWVGKYGGYMQLGGSYNGGIGQMTWETAQAHVFKDGWPEPTHSLLIPEVVSMDVLASEANMGKLITLENVHFSPVEGEVCAAAASDGSAQTLSKTLTSSINSSRTIVVRLSSASDFANKKLPSGNGNLTGILSLYGTTYQFTPRDSMDFAFVGFGKGYVPHGLGTATDPFMPSWALDHQDGTLTAWVSGYIIGTLAPGINETNPVNGNEDIRRTGPFMETTVVIAADSMETDWKKCIVVNLPDTTIRKTINLSDHPENMHQKLTVLGNFKNQLGASGLTVKYGTGAEFVLGNMIIGESLPISETFLTTLGLNKFTTFSVSGTQVWSATTYGATMSGYVSYVNYANEDWMFSPSIFMGGVTNPMVVFSHANYFKTGGNLPSTDFTLWISTDYESGAPTTGTWEKLTIPAYTTAASSWTFYSSGNVIIPSKYLGKNIRLGFKYLSNTSYASTWEIKNLQVKGTEIQ